MSEEQAINYTREAFLHPVNLGMLLVAVVSAFATGNMGLLPSIILTLAFGTELMYLGIVPRLPRYRKHVKLKKLQQQSPKHQSQNIFHRLGPKSQKQFLKLKYTSKLIKENFDRLPYSSQGLLENVRKKVKELISSYLTLLDLYNRYSLYVKSTVEDSLEEEVLKEERKLENMTSERLKRTTKRRINILNKRLKKFEIAKEKYLVCETHLETIEDAVQYIYEQSMTMSNPKEIGMQLDNLVEEVEETSQLIDDMEQEIFPYSSQTTDFDLDAEFLEMEKQQKEHETDNTSSK